MFERAREETEVADGGRSVRVMLEDWFSDRPGTEINPDVRMELPLAGAYLQVEWTDDEAARTSGIWLNYHEVPFSAGRGGALMIPCLSDQEGNMTLRIQGRLGDSVVYRLYRSPQLTPSGKLAGHLADFRDRMLPLFAERRLSLGRFYHAVDTGRLPLMALLQPKTSEDEGCLREIEQATTHLLHVCRRPHTRLRDDDQVRPVGTVRRTGPTTLQHIASHSEHWEARTLRGLRPSRLLARIVTDDLELYENQVVFCLIGRLRKYVQGLLREVEAAQAQRQTAFDLQKLSEDPFFYRRWELLERLFGAENIAAFDTDQKRFAVYSNRLLAVQSTLTQCTASPFYKSLRHTKRISSPLKTTNILRMDPHYGPLFRLWRTLDEAQRMRQQAVDGAAPEECQTLYSAFCQALILEALRQSGFVAVAGETEPVLRLTNEHSNGDCFLTINAAGMFRKSRWVVRVETARQDNLLDCIRLHFQKDLAYEQVLPPEILPAPALPSDLIALIEFREDRLWFHERPSSEQFDRLEKLLRSASSSRSNPAGRRREEAWRRFVNDLRQYVPEPESFELLLLPIFTGLGRQAEEINREAGGLLDNAVKMGQAQQANACLVLLPEAVSTSEPDEMALPWELLRRTNTQGDTFSAEDALHWGNYVAGILSVSQAQVLSVTRVARLFRTHMLMHDLRSKDPLPECPACGRNDTLSILNGGRDGFVCHSCAARWNNVTCPSCNHVYGWVQPGERTQRQAHKLLDDLPITVRQNYEQWMNVLEQLAGDASCCGFCEATDVPFTPICPKCAFCSQATSKNAYCLRCDLSPK